MNRNIDSQLIEKYKGKPTSEFVSFQDKIICARINYNCKRDRQKGLTQGAAAGKMKITAACLSKLENGITKSPSAIIVGKIETLYGIPKGELTESLSQIH